MSYTQYELAMAVGLTIDLMNKRTEACTEYTLGVNDCVAMLVEYDKALRGPKSRAELPFTWGGPIDFLRSLGRAGYTAEQYLESCGYSIVKNKRPLVGDVAFHGGALIASPSGWLTTTETNKGVTVAKQLVFFEPKLSIIARPIKD